MSRREILVSRAEEGELTDFCFGETSDGPEEKELRAKVLFLIVRVNNMCFCNNKVLKGLSFSMKNGGLLTKSI